MASNYHLTEEISGIGKDRKEILRYINLKLASMGQPFFEGYVGEKSEGMSEKEVVDMAESLLNNYKEKMRLLSDTIINPADHRIQNFIGRYFQDISFVNDMRLPFDSFVLDKPGLGREVSLPPDRNDFSNEYIDTYRIKQGILHNPVRDRRTTSGTFHIVKGGLPVPGEKKAVPKIAFAHLFRAAFNPPEDLLELPYTSSQEKRAKLFVSLLLRPTVSPEVEQVVKGKSMEVRFFAPGGLVSNLDFVESIFGNAGDPYLHKNDAALDVEHWTGHTGCIILAPHLTKLRKKDLGLPHWEDASERMRRDGMCWKEENELYNDGVPFKLTCRDESGVVITIIGDNYFGYSKKEIKTMISYSANLTGLCEEEHAGGALAFGRKSPGDYFSAEEFYKKEDKKPLFEDIKKNFAGLMDLQPENYGIDKLNSNIFYVPENAEFSLYESLVSWNYDGERREVKLRPESCYVLPSGHKIHIEKHPFDPSWRLVLTNSRGVFCHKPSTVSGGGKSEISKSLLNAIMYGFFFVGNIEEDFKRVDEILTYDFRKRWNKKSKTGESGNMLKSEYRLGNVIRMLTPFEEYTDEYNKFIGNMPDYIKGLILLIKKLHLSGFSGNYKELFSVDSINGRKGTNLIFNGRKIISSYLRVGYNMDESWRLFSLRPDFIAASKIQMEDDISATITLPSEALDMNEGEFKDRSLKLIQNCEYLFFQRPDEAVHRGYDKEAEEDLAGQNTFTTNYEPLTPADGRDLVDDAISFDEYTAPIKDIISQGAGAEEDTYFISPSHPRILEDNERSKNPRYLQKNPAFFNPQDKYLAEVGTRLSDNIGIDHPVYFPVNSVLPGRRNNPADRKKGIRALSVYSPVHYQQLPELFMDFICSLTGKSPSTTGAGSEGALTKAPFNMLVATTDLNNALLSYILTGYQGFSTAAGYVGPEGRVDHDISILIPEIWCRLSTDEIDADKLIEDGSLEKLEDFEHEGEVIKASRLGYRITEKFVFKFFGRIFEEPMTIFNDRMLKPELQNMDDYIDGIKNITEAQQKSARAYLEDGSVESAIPPLKALIYIMAEGSWEGKDVSDPEVRRLFTRDYVLNSDWYKERLLFRQEREVALWKKHVAYLKEFLSDSRNAVLIEELGLKDKFSRAGKHLEMLGSEEYLKSLWGTIGADPLCRSVEND